MKTYDEIKDIIVNRLGLTDLAAYEAYLKRAWADGAPTPTQEEIDQLSPDVIDNNAFWRIAEELFHTDPVTSCGGTAKPYSVEDAKRAAISMYHLHGFTGYLEGMSLYDQDMSRRSRILEIGPGYGALRDWVLAKGNLDYHAADVYPRISEVDHANVDGTLTQETLGRTYRAVIANNVFQHLSVNQRRIYYRDVLKCLLPGGEFLVSMMHDHGRPHKERYTIGSWCRHYGQFTRIQTKDEIVGDLKAAGFDIEATTLTHKDTWIVLRCARRVEKRSPVAAAVEVQPVAVATA